MSFTTPDMNMKRNNSQRSSQIPGIRAKLSIRARNPPSSRNVSHWYVMKTCPA